MEHFLKDNVASLTSRNRGWVIGQFADDKTPFYSKDFEIKWVKDKKGRTKENIDPPSNNQTTMVLLIKGKVMLELLNENEKVVIDQEGDYILYKPVVSHRTNFLEDSLIIVIRWPSIDSN